jgi:hypothetical protein
MEKLQLSLAEDIKVWQAFLDNPSDFLIILLPDPLTDRLKMFIKNAENQKGIILTKPLFAAFNKNTLEIGMVFDLNSNIIIATEEELNDEEYKFFEENKEKFQETFHQFLMDENSYHK